MFPNYGLVWERTLGGDLDATRANMGAWNRWAATVAHEGGGRLHPVAHVTMRDLDWLDAQLASLSSAGVGSNSALACGPSRSSSAMLRACRSMSGTFFSAASVLTAST